jgi:UDP-2,3-diacylglucosamine pyrophosphatase LpxH
MSSTLKLAISDLHLSDATSLLDCFGDSQQAAFEGLLSAASPGNGPWGQCAEIELIINGDCFDFLVTTPYTMQSVVEPEIALQKLEKIIAAHRPFFAALRSFIAMPGRSVTFIMGNHDVELAFAEVRQRICLEITGQATHQSVYFCLARFYRPLPDVYIEHGNYYDFWNHARAGIWDEAGQPLTTDPKTIVLPVGSRYYQQVSYLASLQYPYFDHIEPAMGSTRQIALLCLAQPDLVLDMARRTMSMMAEPRQALARLAPGEERNPQRLFEEAMLDFVAFRDDMLARKTDWTMPREDTQVSAEDMLAFMALRDALAQPIVEAMSAICIPGTDQMNEDVGLGMRRVLERDPTLRYAIAGHTHMVRIDPISQGAQTYLNTASWTQRFALPAPGAMTPELAAWLRTPDWNDIPLREVTQLVFALITAEDDGPASASLCVWEGGRYGSYRVLA